LGIEKNVVYTTNVAQRNFMPYLLAACDIYAAPSRLEGFGMLQVEANACGKPVIGIKAMGLLDTMIHGRPPSWPASPRRVRVRETTVGDESGYGAGHRIVFRNPRIVDYRASVHDIADHLLELMTNAKMRRRWARPAESAWWRITATE
jgi:alpha-maltose-1-phosphate synthase